MSELTGAWPLARLALRRDRVLVPVWVALLVVTCAASAFATVDLYPSEALRVRAAEALNSSAPIVALYGPIPDVTSLGQVAMTKMTVLYAVFVAFLAIVLVRRHTRVEEESGRAELVGAGAVGAHASYAAAVGVAAGSTVLLGLLAAVANIAGGLPVVGSLAFGASWIGIGLVATGIAAVACQLSASSRTCIAIASSVIAVLFVLRAVGDVSAEWLSWLSPFGWSTRLSAYSHERWWVLLLYLAATVALLGVAGVLRQRRDLASGLLADRRGPAYGVLGSVWSLGWRTHRTMLLLWSAGVAVLGVVLGAMVPSITDLLDTVSARAMIERLGGVSVLEDTMLAAELSVVAVVVTGFAVAVVGHTAADETAGRTEQVLGAGGSRDAVLGTTAVVALGGAAWLLLVTGASLGLGYGLQVGDLGQVPRVAAAGLGQVPAVALVSSLGLLGLALSSRGAVAGWAAMVAFLSLGQLGELLSLPGWLVRLSPYVRAPRLPGGGPEWATQGVLVALVVLVLALAWWRFRDRDIG